MSKYSGLVANRKRVGEDSATQNSENSAETLASLPPTHLVSAPKGPGRPRAKRSDPAYTQITAYVRRDTYRAIKSVLFNQEGEREFSDLVETLLAEYVKSRT